MTQFSAFLPTDLSRGPPAAAGGSVAVMSSAPGPFDRPLDSLSYEEARDELIALVARLEAGAATLEESLALWERGEALGARCQELLDGARERVDARREPAADQANAGVVGIVAEDS